MLHLALALALAGTDPTPLGEPWVQQLAALPPDPEPEHLTNDSHFPTSNENQHWLWLETLRDRGGVYLGLGTDQNYFMAAWARPEVMVLMDFDQVVVDLHRVYFAAFQAADTPKQFLALWRSTKALRAAVEAHVPDPAERARALDALRLYRPWVQNRLEKVLDLYQGQGCATFLDDPDQYHFISELVRAHRVFAVRGDLTADRTVKAVAAAAKAMSMPVRVLYLSNAERYWPLGDGYKANMAALPFDARSVVLRTTGKGSHTSVDPYHYVVEEGANFQLWMQRPWVGKVETLLRHRHPLKARHLYVIDEVPPADPPPDASPPRRRSRKTKG